MPPALEARSVGKRYPNGVQALRGVSLEIECAETVVLVGESGCGKTTLLRMFNRLEEPTAGEIVIAGEPAGAHDPVLLRRRTGYVQQEGGLLPHWSAGRNVELVPALLKWPPERRRRRADELLELVGLPARTYRHRYPGELSGGQRQRVAFARALAGDPQVILLDEPFGALDALTRVEVQQVFLELKRRFAKTMVLVTHDLDEALRLGDRIVVMRAGVVLQAATPAELAAHPADAYVRELMAHARGGGA
jgi:osmoprotectant transport system ATP-binding protein